MPDDRSQAVKDQETIDYYVEHASCRLIDHKIIEVKKRLHDANIFENEDHIKHYSWLLQMLETARPLRLAKEG